MPRNYIANVIHTVVGDPFLQWTNVRIHERNSKVVKEKDLNINMDPEIAQIFRQSNAVSGKLSARGGFVDNNAWYYLYSFQGYFQSSHEGFCK